MYKILCDNELICDSRIEELAVLNPNGTLEVNKAGSFSFVIPPDHPFYNSVKNRKSIIDVYRGNSEEPIFEGICINITDDFFGQRTIECEGELTFFNDSIQRPHKYQGMNPRSLLSAYLDIHNSQVEDNKKFFIGSVTVENSENIFRFTNYQSTMQEISEDLIDNYGGYLRTRHQNGIRYLDYLKESPHTCSQTIKIGKNLIDITKNRNSINIATAIIPLGATLQEDQRTSEAIEGLDERLTIKSVNNGLDYIYNQDSVDEFGWIFKTVTFDDVTTPSALKEKGLKFLMETQFETIVIEATAVDLNIVSDDIENFKLLDMIHVISEPHGLNRNFLLSKIKFDLNNPDKDVITLGIEEKATMTSRSQSVSSDILKIVNAIQPGDILMKAKDNATSLITSAMGGYVYKTNNELFIMDSDNPETAQKVWRWNINGLGYSSTGINGPYGLAMTMDGSIVADYILTGVLTGIEINNGNRTFSVDSNGNMKANSAEITGGKIAMSNGERKALLINKCTIDKSKGHYIYTFINGRGLYVFSTVDNCYTSLTPGHVESGTFTGSINENEGLPDGVITPLATMNYGGMIMSSFAYDNTVSSAPNVYIMENGLFKRSTSSSARYKYDIKEEIPEELNPQKLYDLPVKSFKYNDKHLSKNDIRSGKNILGFIAEDVRDIFEPATQYDSSGNPEMWNVNIIVPAILKLVQEQHKEIEKLKYITKEDD